ncbi:MAG: regulatory protein RecX, partial [Ignavibacterium sp.]
MKVTRIVKKDARNVVVHFDNNETLILLLDVFVRGGLKKNEEISDDRFSLLIKENRLFHIKQRALRYLGRRLHSSSELRIKLKQKGYEIELINTVITNLSKAGYLNDFEFAKEFTKEKSKTKLWGKNKIISELIKKGIPAEIITHVLNESVSEHDEYETAMVLAQKKIKLLKPKLDGLDLKRKVVSFLNTRGYRYDIAGKVCDE